MQEETLDRWVGLSSRPEQWVQSGGERKAGCTKGKGRTPRKNGPPQTRAPRLNQSGHESPGSGPWRPPPPGPPRTATGVSAGLLRPHGPSGGSQSRRLRPQRSKVPFKSLSPNKTPLSAPPWESEPSREEALRTGAAALLHPFGNNNGRPDERERVNQVWKNPQPCNVNYWAPAGGRPLCCPRAPFHGTARPGGRSVAG